MGNQFEIYNYRKIQSWMKSLIEKVILSYFGKFIKGISKQKLHIDLFGGNFQMENISLNHQYFDELNTPFKLSFSSIGIINIQAPLSKLSSVPVQCILNNIYMIFEFRDSQSTIMEQQFRKKRESVQKCVRQIFTKYLQKINNDKKQDGMFAKMGKKIIDNLQLKIVNVHVRFQERIKKGYEYGWGLTLEEISFIPTDAEWKTAFLDRTIETNKNHKLFKMMSVKKLNLYWHSTQQSQNNRNSKQLENQKQFLINQIDDNNTKKSLMAQLINENKNVILSITSEFRLTINPLDKLDQPIYELNIGLQPIKFQLERNQISQMIDFIQKNILKNQIILRNLTTKKSRKKQLKSHQKLQIKQKFITFVRHILSIQSKQSSGDAHPNIIDDLRHIFQHIDIDQLMIWAIQPIKNKVKKVREIQLKKKKRGWFGGQNQLTEGQIKQMEVFLQQVFQGEEPTRPLQCLLFRVMINIKQGRFILVNRKQKENYDLNQRIQFSIGEISLLMAKSQDQSFTMMKLQVQKINLDVNVPLYNSNKPSLMSILATEDVKQGKNQKFIKVIYEKKVQTKKQAQIKTSIKGQIQRIIVTYKKIYLKKFKQFFTFQNVNQYTLQKIQQMAESTNVNNSQEQPTNLQNSMLGIHKIFDIQLDIISPIFICPLNDQQCWCLSLGNLQLRSKSEQDYQCYPINITSAYLKYYPTLELCSKDRFNKNHNEQYINEVDKSELIYSVINDMNFHIVAKQIVYQQTWVVDIKLPSFEVNFSEKQYNNLLSLKNIFKTEEENENLLETLKKQKLQIQGQMSYSGTIFKKNQTLNVWRQYFSILSGHYIYFYNNPKQLRFTQRIYIKSSKLVISEEELSFQLLSQDQDCYFKCQDQLTFNKWTIQIQIKLKENKNVYQLMELFQDQDSQSQNSISFNKTPNKKQKQYLRDKKTQFTIVVQRIGFKYEKPNRQPLLKIQINQLKISTSNSNQGSQTKIGLSEMIIVDYLHKYHIEAYQHLLRTQLLQMSIYKRKPQRSKVQQKKSIEKKIIIKITLKQLLINWKPDVILVLLRLSSQHLQKFKQMRMDDDQFFTRAQHFKQVTSNPKFSYVVNQYREQARGRYVKNNRQNYFQRQKWMHDPIKVDCWIGQAKITLIHRQSHMAMFQIISKGFSNQFSMNEDHKFVSGYLDTLQLYDMTGYPRKHYDEKSQYPPYKLASKKRSDTNILEQQKPLIIYNWSSFEPMCLPNEQRVNSFLYIEVSPIELIYFQQLTFRIIDYVLIQIMLLLQEPQMLTVNQNLLEQLKKSNSQIKQKPITILFSEYQEIVKRLINPYFMDMFLEINKPTIIMKAQKNSLNYFSLDIDKLVFSNLIKKSSQRFMKSQNQQVRDYIYEEQYHILCKDTSFNTIRQDNQAIVTQTLFGPVQMEVFVNKLIQEDQINILYPQINTYDRSFKTISKCSPINILSLQRKQYLLINQLVNFNFTFDDEKDQLFIHNFKITKLLSPKPIFYQLFIPRLIIHCTHYQTIQLFNMSIDSFRMQYKRNKDLNSSFGVWMGNTTVLGYQLLNRQQYKSNKQIPKSYKQTKLLQLKGEDEQGSDIMIDMKVNGEKVINFNMKYLDVFVDIGLLQLIFEWSLTEDWIFPTRSTYLTEITFFATVHEMSAFLMQNVQETEIKIKSQSEIDKLVNKKQSLICKASDKGRMFKLLGVLCYKFHRKKNFTQEILMQKLANKQISLKQFEDMPQTSYMTVILNTEAYHCLNGNKRKVIEKFTFNLMEKRHLKIANHDNFLLKTVAKRTMNIDRWDLKISFTDILLMKQILEKMQKERQYIQYINKLQTNQEIIPLKKQTEISSLQNLEINIETVSLYIINNCRQRFIPVLRINLQTITLTVVNTFKKSMMEGQFKIGLDYFNGTIFKWQPVIQKTMLCFHRLIYYDDKKTIISLECINPVRINVSREMFAAVKLTVAEWQRVQNQSRIYDNEPVQFISHYIIRNQTGYFIEIYNSDKIKKYQIAHLEEIDYSHEVNEYNDQNQEYISIGVKIIHPTYKFKIISNVAINPQKQYKLLPRTTSNQTIPSEAIIIIKPEVKHSKQYLIIASKKIIQDYRQNPTEVTILPFDHSQSVYLKFLKLNVSLYRQVQDPSGIHRFLGKQGTLKIMKKDLVYNFTPIPLEICGYWVPSNGYIGISEKLTIQGLREKDSILRIQRDDKLKEYYIYCESYVVDYYGLQFSFGPDYKFNLYSQQIQLNAHHKHTVYLLPHSDQRFKIRMNKKSPWVYYTPSLGKSIIKLQNETAKCHFSGYAYLTALQNSPVKQFKKVIEITPQYIISNTTKYLLKVSQIDCCSSVNLKPLERLPFFWEDKTKPQILKIAVYDGEQFWGYSGGIKLHQSTLSLILRKGSDPTCYRVFSLQVERTSTVTFFHFMETSAKYMLCNNVFGVTMVVYQTAILEKDLEFDSKQFIYHVGFSQEKPFGYQLPIQSHQLTVQFVLDQSLKQFQDLYCQPILLDDLELNLFQKSIYLYSKQDKERGQSTMSRQSTYSTQSKSQMKQKQKSQMKQKLKKKTYGKMKLILIFEGNVKKLKLITNEEVIDYQPKYQFIAKIPQFGISFIGLYQKIRKQLIFILLQKIQLQIYESEVITDYILQIDKIRIENLLQINVQFPVLFKTINNNSKRGLTLILSRDLRNPTLIHNIGFSLNKFTTQITSEEIQVLQTNIIDIMNVRLNSLDEEKLIIRKYQLFTTQIPDAQNILYFVEAQLSPLNFQVTFKHVNNWGGKLLKTFSSINECSISIKGNKLSHFTCKNIGQFYGVVSSYYHERLTQNILPMIGNLSILGSPMVLVNKIGSGVKDMIELPFEGFQISAKEGGRGIARGAQSLLTNTFQGTFNSLESLTGSIGNGLSSLVDDDDDYSRRRQKLKNERSDNVLDGLSNGAKSIANGFSKGVIGVFKKPIQGAERQGIAGFFKGGFMGITGLVIKPISGIIDATSKTAQGIKNSAGSLNPNQKNNITRFHNPRPFYHHCRQFRQYDIQLAYCALILQNVDTSRYSQLSWAGHFLIKSQKVGIKTILLLNYSYTIIFELVSRKVIKQYHSEDIIGVQMINPNTLSIRINDKKKNKAGSLKIEVEGNARRLFSEVRTLVQSFNPTYGFDYEKNI